MSPVHPVHAPYSVPGLKQFPDTLYVVTCVNNPCRFHSRYRHYRTFEKHVQDSGAILLTVEAAFGGRDFEITVRDNPRHVQVRGGDLTEIWLKENLMNIGLSRLPPEARYIAFVDADITFARPDWAQETLQQLQHYAAVQMFSHVSYLNFSSEILSQNLSFMEAWQTGLTLRTPNGMATCETVRKLAKSAPYPYQLGKKGGFGAPGAAWAWRREALDQVGGLIDFSILGSGDYQMATALIGHMGLSISNDYSAGYRDTLFAWQDRAERHVRRNVGQVSGSILHHWHGPMGARGYDWRWKLLTTHKYDPRTDLTRDSQGLLRLHDDGSTRFLNLRDGLRGYFRQRNEDSIGQ